MIFCTIHRVRENCKFFDKKKAMLIMRENERTIHATGKTPFHPHGPKNVNNFFKMRLTFVIRALKYTL